MTTGGALVDQDGPGIGQEDLLFPAEQGLGRHETALDASAQAAGLGPRHAAAVSACRAGARALDQAEQARRPQVVAQLLRSYLDALGRCGLLPDPAGFGTPLVEQEGDSGGVDLAGFSRPTLVHAAHA